MSAMSFQPLTIESAYPIADAIAIRVERGEDVVNAALTVLLNAGDSFAPVSCVAGEWAGFKGDLPKMPGIPKCPNGHVCMQGEGLRLGFAP